MDVLSSYRVEKSGSESACILGASTSGRFRSRSIERKEGRKEERGERREGNDRTRDCLSTR